MTADANAAAHVHALERDAGRFREKADQCRLEGLPVAAAYYAAGAAELQRQARHCRERQPGSPVISRRRTPSGM